MKRFTIGVLAALAAVAATPTLAQSPNDAPNGQYQRRSDQQPQANSTDRSHQSRGGDQAGAGQGRNRAVQAGPQNGGADNRRASNQGAYDQANRQDRGDQGVRYGQNDGRYREAGRPAHRAHRVCRVRHGRRSCRMVRS